MGFLPDDPGFVANPYPVYERLREDHPVLYDDATNHWLVSRWADVNSLLRDRRFGRTYLHLATHEEMGHAPDPPHLDPFWHLIRSGILDMEPPDHTRVRRLVSKAFTPKTVEQLKPSVESIVLRLVEDVRGTGEFDLISRVAEPLPVEIIAEMLGVPESERHHLRPWSAEICLMYELNPSPEYERRAVTASVEFTEFLRELARDRRRTPRDDLITRLTQVVDDGRTLSEDELVGTCVLLLNAGHEATVNATGNGWWALFRNSDQLERLRGDQSLLPRTVEELLRYDTPLQMFERWVLEDVEIHGHRIPRGAELGLLFGSANHDPSVFADPWELDLGRDPNPHVTFGAGIHFCLGAPLARVELETSLRTLLENVPDMELVAEPQWKPGYIIRGLEALHVRG
ncbi:MAG TPA: cytochrome P450 [Actinomycetota bacterium]|nr:cytochrome P450 [Actinomycetota bacterium]